MGFEEREVLFSMICPISLPTLPTTHCPLFWSNIIPSPDWLRQVWFPEVFRLVDFIVDFFSIIANFRLHLQYQSDIHVLQKCVCFRPISYLITLVIPFNLSIGRKSLPLMIKLWYGFTASEVHRSMLNHMNIPNTL